MTASTGKRIALLFVTVIVLGISFRVTNLNLNPYWLDETYTLLRSSSHTAQAATQQLFNGQIIRAEDVLRYQQPTAEDRGGMGTIAGLALEEPQHPPLFFLLARGWAQVFGDSKLAMRSLPVVGSLLTFPAIYWLCLELSLSPLVGWLTIALVAVSPIQVRYAQEVRQYSLWLTLVLLACVLCLRAIRQPTKLNWGIYAVTIAIGLYCHLLTGLVVVAHGIYVVVRERLRWTNMAVAYLCAATIGTGIALPWFWLVYQNRTTMTQTLEHFSRSLSFWSLLQFWSLSLDRLWIAWHFQYNFPLIYLTIPVLALISYALYFFCRYAPRQTWLFILILLAIVFFPFAISDLVWGGRRSTSERYFLLCYVAIDLIVAYLFAAKLTQPFCSGFHNRLWRSIVALVLSAGVVCCLSGVLSPTWWGWSEFDVNIAQITNAAPHPLIISDVPFSGIVPLIHELKHDTALILLHEPSSLHIPAHFSERSPVFLYNPSDRLLSTFKQQNVDSNQIYQFQDPITTLVVSLYQLSL